MCPDPMGETGTGTLAKATCPVRSVGLSANKITISLLPYPRRDLSVASWLRHQSRVSSGRSVPSPKTMFVNSACRNWSEGRQLSRTFFPPGKKGGCDHAFVCIVCREYAHHGSLYPPEQACICFVSVKRRARNNPQGTGIGAGRLCLPKSALTTTTLHMTAAPQQQIGSRSVARPRQIIDESSGGQRPKCVARGEGRKAKRR
jgi:hypothetical protein